MRVMLMVMALLLVVAPMVMAQVYPGVVTVDSAQAQPTEQVSVKVWLRNNDINVSAISIPLKFTSDALTLDSVSLVNSIWTADFGGYYVIDNVARTVRITVLPGDIEYPLPAISFVDAVVAEMFFTVSETASPGSVMVDSIYTDEELYGDVHVYTRIDVSDNSGSQVFQPDFVPGNIEILVPTDVDDGSDFVLPQEFALAQNYPNPFNPSTIITFSMPRAGQVKLQVYNILGQAVATLADGRYEAGTHQVEFSGENYPSGIYFYRLQQDTQSATRKMMLVK